MFKMMKRRDNAWDIRVDYSKKRCGWLDDGKFFDDE